jgi:hypothetical protein
MAAFRTQPCGQRAAGANRPRHGSRDLRAALLRTWIEEGAGRCFAQNIFDYFPREGIQLFVAPMYLIRE